MDQNAVRRRGVGTRGIDPDTVLDGYTLYAPLSGKKIYLIENSGNVVREWEVPYRIGRAARFLPNGNIAVACKDPDARAPFLFFNKYGGGIYLELDPQGNIVNEYRDPLGHHDFQSFGGGHLLYASLEPLSAEAAAALPGGVSGTEAPDGKVWSDTIKEVKDGKVVWEWC